MFSLIYVFTCRRKSLYIELAYIKPKVGEDKLVEIEKLKKFIDSEIRPALEMEGGFIELIDVKEGVVLVRLGGACAGCPMSQFTLKNFVEALIKENFPDVKEVVTLA